MLDPLFLKSILLVLIFLCGWGGGYLALFFKKNKWQVRLIYGDYFSRGLFLGAGMVHLLPEAASEWWQFNTPIAYPWVFVCAALTIYFFNMLESLFKDMEEKMHTYLVFFLFIILSIHSFLEGWALGLNTAPHVISILFIAIFFHKAADTFVLGNQLNKTKIIFRFQHLLILALAFMSPLGILLGDMFHYYLATQANNLTCIIFNAIAAGSFLYLASHHHSFHTASLSRPRSFNNMMFFGMGLILMLLIAVWI